MKDSIIYLYKEIIIEQWQCNKQSSIRKVLDSDNKQSSQDSYQHKETLNIDDEQSRLDTKDINFRKDWAASHNNFTQSRGLE